MDIAHAPLWLQAVVLGLVQGLTEFLPISSSGHLILVPALTGWQHMGKTFDVALHFGTLVAIVVYFRADVLQLLRAFKELLGGSGIGDDLHRKLVVWLVVATIPAGAIGLLLDKWLEQHFGTIGWIALFVGLFGVLMGVADRLGRKDQEIGQLSLGRVLLIGCAQALALMPGVSRSGSTMTACLLLGLTRAEAARFSFLMALPVTAAACFLKGVKLIKAVVATGDVSQLEPCLIGIVVSGISGWLCMHYLLRYLRQRSFMPFIIYRVALSLFLVGWMLSHSA